VPRSRAANPGHLLPDLLSAADVLLAKLVQRLQKLLAVGRRLRMLGPPSGPPLE
jgi:hypothetical protein